MFPSTSPELESACKFSDYLLNQLSCELRIDSDGVAYTKAEVCSVSKLPPLLYRSTSHPNHLSISLLLVYWRVRRSGGHSEVGPLTCQTVSLSLPRHLFCYFLYDIWVAGMEALAILLDVT